MRCSSFPPTPTTIAIAAAVIQLFVVDRDGCQRGARQTLEVRRDQRVVQLGRETQLFLGELEHRQRHGGTRAVRERHCRCPQIVEEGVRACLKAVAIAVIIKQTYKLL